MYRPGTPSSGQRRVGAEKPSARDRLQRVEEVERVRERGVVALGGGECGEERVLRPQDQHDQGAQRAAAGTALVHVDVWRPRTEAHLATLRRVCSWRIGERLAAISWRRLSIACRSHAASAVSEV